MGLLYPSFNSSRFANSVVWSGRLQPTALSQEYELRIQYCLGYIPEIRVIKPELTLHRDHKKLPHFYHDKGLLCVHTSDEWRPDLIIARTIMQWISGWLYFYEIWLATGFWLGGGTHVDALQHRSA